jgi:imidazolonepropionase-like amidohydrolase
LAAFVEEADKAQTYVCGHLYSDEAVRRAVEIGFQSVEHATLVEPATAKLMKEKNVIVTPTIIAYESQKTEEKALRLDHLVSPRGSTRDQEESGVARDHAQGRRQDGLWH